MSLVWIHKFQTWKDLIVLQNIVYYLILGITLLILKCKIYKPFLKISLETITLQTYLIHRNFEVGR